VADNSTQGGTDTIRDKDRTGVKTQIQGLDLNIGGGSEVLQTAAALADATANPTVPAWAMMGMLYNGTTWDRMRGDTTNGLDVDVTRLPGSPAQEHTTAASPNSARLSDGAAFYNTNTGAQLPSALVGGRLDVNIGASGLSSLAVANVETLVDNAGFTDGTSKVFPQGYVFDEAAGTALTENDVAAGRVDSKRAIVNVIEDATTRGQRASVQAAADGMANSTGQVVVNENELYNGTTWDRQHGAWRTTTGDTGAKTATFNGATQTNFDSRGAYITIRLGTVSGSTPTLNFTLAFSPDNGTTWVSLGPASGNLTASSQIGMLVVYPTNSSQAAGATPANLGSGANIATFLNLPLPRTWRLVYTIGGTTPSFTITAVDVNYCM